MASEASEGPVMALISKRLRALRKKQNRITQMEESKSQGKTLNKEQEEVLRSKAAVVLLIEEYEKFRTPLSAAVAEEISLATQQQHHAPSDQTTAPEVKEGGNDVTDLQQEVSGVGDGGAKLEDLVNLLYFGSLFDVKSQNEFTSIMVTKSHERSCCLTYDYVTDDATDLLGDKDLDSISQLWSLMVSRPADSSLTHKNALERCVEHAKLWLANSEQPIESICNISYAALREKLKKIMASDYLTTTPEMKAPVDVAAAAGNYSSFQVPVDMEASAGGDYQQKEEDASQEQESVGNEQIREDKYQKLVAESKVVYGQQDQGYGQQDQGFTQVEGRNGKRDYVPRGSYQNQRGRRGARRGGGGGYQNGRGGRAGGGGGNQNGRYESYDQSGGNGYQRNYYNNKGRGRGGGGGGNGQSYNNYQESNVATAAS